MNRITDTPFAEAVQGLMAGDFSRLAPLFENASGSPAVPVVRWFDEGLFATEPAALAEAFTCACFNGCTPVMEHFLTKGVNPMGGINTGLNAFHWAANRGQLKAVEMLIRHNAPLEARNAYGGTVLGCAVWSVIHEPRQDHVRIIEALLKAGANPGAAEYPSGNEKTDELLRQFGAGK